VADLVVRAANESDAAAVQRIYAPIVERTAISFEVVAPSVAEVGDRIAAVTRSLPWLVAEEAGVVVGYAYAGRHAERAAYRWSVDVSIYLAEGARGRRIGTRLYGSLFDELRHLGYVSAYAGVTLPNAASVALHESMGFAAIGTFPNAGFKFDAWHTVGWWYLALQPTPRAPREPSAGPVGPG
jgi:L-amino acid N-acyltransferase YncA